MLWFTMMVMPAGPPALIISGLAELGKVSEMEKMAMAKALTVSNLGQHKLSNKGMLNIIDSVYAVADHLPDHYRGIESIRSSTRQSGIASCTNIYPSNWNTSNSRFIRSTQSPRSLKWYRWDQEPERIEPERSCNK
jgi:hypothetical protein